MCGLCSPIGSPVQKGPTLSSVVAVLKLFIIFWQGSLHFNFALGLANYVADLAWIICFLTAKSKWLERMRIEGGNFIIPETKRCDQMQTQETCWVWVEQGCRMWSSFPTFKSHFCMRLNYRIYNVNSLSRKRLVIVSFEKCFPKSCADAFWVLGSLFLLPHKLT